MIAREWDAVIDYACMYVERLQQLYTVISNAFPDDRAFWQTLAEEQTQHLKALQQVKKLCASNAITLDTSRIHGKAIESAFPYMEVVKASIENKRWLYSKIIAEVRDFEQNLLDCGLMPALQSAGGNEHPIIEPLSLSIKRHCNQLLAKRSDIQSKTSLQQSDNQQTTTA